MAVAFHQLGLGQAILYCLDMFGGIGTKDFVEIADLDSVEMLISHGRPPGVSGVAGHMLG
ncbi:hypothetical protein D9M68_902790 [compost metagenome]